MPRPQLEYYITKYSDCSVHNNMILIDSLRQNNNKSIKEIIRNKGFTFMSLLWILIIHNNVSH